MFEITITEITANGGVAGEPLKTVERLRLTVDTVDIMAVIKAASGVRRKRKGKEKAA